jgi:hypothetical protein
MDCIIGALIMYKKLLTNPMTGAEEQCIKRLSDNAFIPFAPDNTDYQEYLKWVAEGGTPLPAENE